MRLEDLRPGQLREAIASGHPVLLPTGCIEYHGPHLPLGCDAIIVQELAFAVAAEAPAVVAPPLWYGPTGYAVTGPDEGTMDVTVERFGRHAKDVLLALWRMGFRHILVIQHHQGIDGPEGLALRQAASEIAFEQAVATAGEGWWGGKDFAQQSRFFGRIQVLSSVQPEAAETVRGDHAGATETSLMLHLRPDACDMSLLDPSAFHFLATAPDGSAAKGKMMFEAMVAALVRRVRELG